MRKVGGSTYWKSQTSEAETNESEPEIIGMPGSTEGDDWNLVEKVVFERRSVRKYKDDQVPEHLVYRVLEAGRFAPSSGNIQPWKIMVIRDKEMLNEMERYIIGRNKLFRFFLDFRRPGVIGRIAWLNLRIMVILLPHKLHPAQFWAMNLVADGKSGVFYGAPSVIMLMKDRRAPWKPELDLGICGQNMALTAQSLGLGTCWLSIVGLLNFGTKWKRRLGIRYPYELVCALTLGYPAGDAAGIVPRETRQIDWYEGGRKRTIY